MTKVQSDMTCDERVILLTLTLKDSEITKSILNDAGIKAFICKDINEACSEVQKGAGLILIAEEYIYADKDGYLLNTLKQQAAWSELPVGVLTNVDWKTPYQIQVMEKIGNLTLLKRPVQILPLLSMIKSALRDRKRQYNVRDYLAEIEKQSKELKASEERLRFLTELEEATRDLQDPKYVMQIAADMLGKHLKVTRCAYADVEANGNEFTIRYDYVIPGERSTVGFYSLDLFGPKAVNDLNNSHTLILKDIKSELSPGAGLEAFDEIGINAIITCPLVKEGHLKAMMAVHQKEARNWTTAEIRFVEAVAERCWSYIERLRAEIKLKESEQQLRHITEAIPQQVWTARPDGQLDYINAYTRDYAGEIPITDGIVQWVGVVNPEDLPNSIEIWKKSLETGNLYEVEQRIIHKKSGKYRWNLSRALPLTDETGKIIKWYGTNTDIDQQKQIETDLKEARDSAEVANIAKTEFLANMSHEIRTPMNAIIGLSNILSGSKPLTDKQLEYIKTLQMSADSLLNLINDLLDISKIEARSVELEETSFSVVNLVHEVISMMNVRAKEKGLSFTAEQNCECADEREFVGDPTRLRQILVNLCSNSIKFTEAGSVKVNIICDKTDNKELEIINLTVTDTGIGIAPDKIDTIFQKFIQGDSSINRKYGGTGLGLAITKTLAEIMGGNIVVKSELGKGSSFKVSIPLKVIKNANIELKNQIKDTKILDAPEKELNSGYILLAEDYAPNVLVAKTFIESFGYECEVASNGSEAINMFNMGKYDLILMDVQMPIKDGLQATQEIRRIEKSKNLIPVYIIGMTAHALAGDQEICFKAGMNDYISKPFNPLELKSKLNDNIAAKKAGKL